MSFPNAGEPLLPGQEKALSTNKTNFFGAIGYTPDGRRFRYAKTGATSIGGGQAVQAAAIVGSGVHSFGLKFSTAYTSTNTLPAGQTLIPLIMVTTNVSSANMYVDGFIQVDTGPDSGMYMIKKHPAISSAATGVFELYADDKIKVAWTTLTEVGLRRNPYAEVVVTGAGTTAVATGLPLGVTPREIPANTYFWLQDEGVASVNADTTAPQVGGPFGFISGSSNGHIIAWTTALGVDIDDKPMVARSAGAGAAADKAHFVAIRF